MAKTRRKKKRTHVPEAPEADKKVPRSFVFRRGKHSAVLKELVQDLRQVMLPYTAVKLQESRRNLLKDFVSVAGPLGITHFLILSATQRSSYLKIAKSPRGPTLTCRIESYSLVRDVQRATAHPRVPANAFLSPPLLVMNKFGSEPHLQLASTLLQHMFPAINVGSVKLAACQRVVLLQRDAATGLLQLRHYGITVAPSGLRKSVKALLAHKRVPDCGALQDVSELVTKSGYGSESEGEDAEASRVTLSQDLGRGNTAARASRVRLHEIGPRLTLAPLKLEEGCGGGRVLFHAHVEKSAAEEGELDKRHAAAAALKQLRKQQQEENVRRKHAEAARKAELQAEAEARKAGAAARRVPQRAKADDEDAAARAYDVSDGDDEDVEYYRSQVGQDPDEGELMRRRVGRGRGGAARGAGRGRGFEGTAGGGRQPRPGAGAPGRSPQRGRGQKRPGKHDVQQGQGQKRQRK